MNGWGIAALITGSFFLMFLSIWLSWQDQNHQAAALCKRSGYPDGKYDPKRGVVCLSEHPQPLVSNVVR